MLVTKTLDVYEEGNFHLMEISEDLANAFAYSDASDISLRDAADTTERPYFCCGERDDDDVVLCTQTQTFSVRQVHTSNTLLLVSLNEMSTSQTFAVRDTLSLHLEVDRSAPRLGQLRRLLESSVFAGPEHDRRRGRIPLLAISDLKDLVQGSEAEIKKGLEQMEACDFEGFYRLIDPAYLTDFLRYVMACAQAEEIDNYLLTNAFILDCAKSHGVPSCAALHCIKLVSTYEKGLTDYTLVPAKVSRTLGRHLLASMEDAADLNAFLRQWSEMTQPFEVALDHLRGCYLLWNNGATQQIEYFAKSDLPYGLEPRLQELFDRKPRWSFEELADFIDNEFETEQQQSSQAPTSSQAIKKKKNLEAQLLKFCRVSKVRDTQWFTKR